MAAHSGGVSSRVNAWADRAALVVCVVWSVGAPVAALVWLLV
jgi:hypothetical protein